MRTPFVSRITPSQYWDAIRHGNPTHVNIVFTETPSITLNDSDIDIDGGVVLEDFLNSDTDLTFGRAVMKKFTAQVFINDKTRNLQWDRRCELRFGVEINGTTAWCSIGYFYGTRPSHIDTARSVEFVAYDAMHKFDKMAGGSLTGLYSGGVTLKVLCNRICQFVGVTAPNPYPDDKIWNKLYYSKPVEDDSYTCRDLIAWIAEATGRYAKINIYDQLNFVWYEDHTNDLTIEEDDQFEMDHEDIIGYTWDEFDELTWDEADLLTWNEATGYDNQYSISSVRVRQSSQGLDVYYPEWSTYPPTHNVYLISDNPFFQFEDVQEERRLYIEPLYNRLNAFGSQLPMHMECVGNWMIEAGDIIKVISGDMTIAMPVFVKTTTWKGFVVDSYEVTGARERTQQIPPKAQSQIATSKLIKLYVDETRDEITGQFYQRRSGIEINTSGVEITGSKYVSIEAADNEKWLFDDSGLRYIDTRFGYTIFNLSQSYNSHYGNALAGICPYRTALNDTHGRICFWASGGDGYSGGSQGGGSPGSGYKTALIYECDNTSGGRLYPNRDLWQYGMNTHLGNPSIPDKHGWFYNGYIVSLYSLAVNTNIIYGDPADTVEENGNDYCYIDIHPKKYKYNLSGSARSARTMNIRDNETYFSIRALDEGAFQTIKIYDGQFVSSSSRAKKHNIQNLDDYGRIIDQLNPVSFVYNNDAENHKRFGLIYEDTVKVLPEICSETSEKNKKSYFINYQELIPILLKEVQDLRKRVAELEGRCN